MSQRPEAWSVEDVERRCGVLREQLAAAASHVVTEAELDAGWPGGAENPHPAPACWWYCWGTYIAFARRLQVLKAPAEHDAKIRAILARRSARAPERVTLTDGRTVAVHPKSYWALCFLDMLDRELRLAEHVGREWLDDVSLDAQRVVALVPLMQGLAVRVFVWILTHPTPELPFGDDEVDLTPPEWTASITAADLLAICRAHAQVHAEDLQLIGQAFPGEEGVSRLGLEGVLNSYAGEAGIAPFDVFRRLSLGEVFASAVSRAETGKEALERAEAKRGSAKVGDLAPDLVA